MSVVWKYKKLEFLFVLFSVIKYQAMEEKLYESSSSSEILEKMNKKNKSECCSCCFPVKYYWGYAIKGELIKDGHENNILKSFNANYYKKLEDKSFINNEIGSSSIFSEFFLGEGDTSLNEREKNFPYMTLCVSEGVNFILFTIKNTKDIEDFYQEKKDDKDKDKDKSIYTFVIDPKKKDEIEYYKGFSINAYLDENQVEEAWDKWLEKKEKNRNEY